MGEIVLGRLNGKGKEAELGERGGWLQCLTAPGSHRVDRPQAVGPKSIFAATAAERARESRPSRLVAFSLY